MIPENLRVLPVDGPANWITLADEVVDDELLRNEEEGLLRRDVPVGEQTDQLAMLAKGNWVVDCRILCAVLLQPSVKLDELLFLLQPLCDFSVDNRERVPVMLLDPRDRLLPGGVRAIYHDIGGGFVRCSGSLAFDEQVLVRNILRFWQPFARLLAFFESKVLLEYSQFVHYELNSNFSLLINLNLFL